MKRTDLEKLNGLKIQGRMKRDGTPERFRPGAENAAKAPVNPLIEKLLRKSLGPKSGR
ncbi:hypothetical protein [Aromatoleum bremense]|uniref:hypothetical protein n=1 Tax=Aromatoleum bremense TaxID=76115 RepID=UPI00145E32C4|nr:hypothetical protein [Aromatoleum bremense]QTQ30932.1 Uncharacterized protein pbN1_09400 [Aromatoleum bremense]